MQYQGQNPGQGPGQSRGQNPGQQPPYPQQPAGAPGQGYQSQPQYAQPQGGYQQAPYPQPGYPPPGYQQQGYAQPGYPQQPVYGAAMGTPFPIVGGVRTPMLIAAIWHCIVLVGSLWLVLTIIFAWVPIIPLLFLIFEFKTYSRLNGMSPPSAHRGGANTVAIFQIVSILWGDVPAAICGIIAVSNMSKMQP